MNTGEMRMLPLRIPLVVQWLQTWFFRLCLQLHALMEFSQREMWDKMEEGMMPMEIDVEEPCVEKAMAGEPTKVRSRCLL